ncbi:MOSC domain-containing protein [Streptomyces sp. NPDC048419]|uniref:MOSC domain-containing protein n=1 Tax=Streptomyces sp. NPDC048419 TaxID=3365547 RepID=UPI00371B4B15
MLITGAAILPTRRPIYGTSSNRRRQVLAVLAAWRRSITCSWLGSRLRVGEALFRVMVPTPRCVIPTLGHDELPPDPGIMRAVAREHRVPVFDLGRLSCLGVYLEVLEAGTVRVRDAITVQAPGA